MRTTVNLPDSLLEQAKARSLAEGRSLGSILADGLRVVLALEPAVGPTRVNLITYGREGTLPGVDLDDSADLLELMERP